MKLGEKIKTLRKQKNISQEVLAQYLGVTFQAVSKWENGTTMPDVATIPAIASFFGVSTDELFDFNLYETQKQVEAIVDEHSRYWHTDKHKAEQIIRDGLKKYPGNENVAGNTGSATFSLRMNTLPCPGCPPAASHWWEMHNSD